MSAIVSGETGRRGARAGAAVKCAGQAAALTARQVVEDFDDNAEAIDILKKSGPVGILFLLA